MNPMSDPHFSLLGTRAALFEEAHVASSVYSDPICNNVAAVIALPCDALPRENCHQVPHS